MNDLFSIGSRNVILKDSICVEEDDILSDYLSNCTLDQANHCMSLPDEKEHEIPEGFDCVYYREAKERMYEATVDDESYTVIVLDEKGWDSDATEKRNKEQVCDIFSYQSLSMRTFPLCKRTFALRNSLAQLERAS